MAWANSIDELSPTARFLGGIGRKYIRPMDDAAAVELSPSAPSLRPQIQPKEQAPVPLEAIMAGSKLMNPQPDPALTNVDEDAMHEEAAIARQAGIDSQRNTPAPSLMDPKMRPGWIDSLIGAAATFGAALQRNPDAMKLGINLARQKFNNATADWENQQGQVEREQKAFDQGEARYDRSRRRQQDKQELALRKDTLNRQLENDKRMDENRRRDDQRADKAQAERERTDRSRETYQDRMATAAERRADAAERKADRQDKPKDYAAQKRVIEDDIGTKMQKHKDALQDDIDKVNKNRSAGLYSDEQYKEKMAALERRDYQVMREIGKDKQRQYGALGEKIDAPEPAAWENSFLSDKEKPKATPDASAGPTGKASTSSASAPQAAQKTATMADVEAYAKKKNITAAEARRAFEKAKYTIK